MPAAARSRPFGLAGAVAAVLALAPGVSVAARPTPDAPPRTSCRTVAHIGDSLSVGLVSKAFIPDEDARIEAQYERVGARDVRLEISGARSVVEHLDGQLGGEEVAEELREDGFRGCWVIALGTNDAANVAVGSSSGYSDRIDRMMAIVGDDPVVWVDVATRRERGPYASPNMRRFNQALEKAHARYPDLQVYEWSGDVVEDWFDRDGIHYTAVGYTYRAALIAAALADAFPA